MAIGKKTGGKDFVKGDPRINRNGRPKKITATTLKEVLAFWKSGEITDEEYQEKDPSRLVNHWSDTSLYQSLVLSILAFARFFSLILII